MNDYQLDPNVCPSSLDENGLPMDINETAHKWDDSTDPKTCSECGAEKETLSDGELLDLLYEELDRGHSLGDLGGTVAKLLKDNR